MPRPHPQEFRGDVAAIALLGETPVKQIAKDFGISESCLWNWIRVADVEEGAKPGATKTASAELRENKLLRRAAAYFAQAHLPGG